MQNKTQNRRNHGKLLLTAIILMLFITHKPLCNTIHYNSVLNTTWFKDWSKNDKKKKMFIFLYNTVVKLTQILLWILAVMLWRGWMMLKIYDCRFCDILSETWNQLVHICWDWFQIVGSTCCFCKIQQFERKNNLIKFHSSA